MTTMEKKMNMMMRRSQIMVMMFIMSQYSIIRMLLGNKFMQRKHLDKL